MSGKDRTTTDRSSYESKTSYTSGGRGVGGGGAGGGGGGVRDADASSSVYRPMMTSRNLIIQRTSYGGPGSSASYGGGGGGGGRSYSIERSAHFGGGMMGVPAGAYANVTSTGVTSVRASREKEKKDMQDLNERFASYIEKVRFLEAQNRKLADELEKLKAGWGKETNAIKAMFQAELDEARKLLDDNEREKARLEVRVASLEEQLDEARIRGDDASRTAADYREKVERQNQQLSDYEAEINLLRRRLESLENDRDKDKKQLAHLMEALNRARMDLDNETLLHIDAENRRQTLEEQMEFMKSVHEQEMKELTALVYRDTTSENREFWKNEMGQALREIQQVYDDKIDNMRGEMETFYNMKVQEFRTGATRQNIESSHSKEESKRLKTQLTDLYDKIANLEGRNGQMMRDMDILRREKEDRERELEAENGELKTEVIKLRAELEAVMQEVQHLMDTKLGLELEISAYRKLLESEENRFYHNPSGGYSDAGGKSIGGSTAGGKNIDGKGGVTDTNRGVANRDRGVSDRDRGVSDRDRGVSDKDREVSDRDRGVSDKDRGVSDRDRGVSDRDRGVSDRDRGVSDRYGVSDRDRGVSDRDRGVSDRDRGVSDRDRGVSDKDRGVSDRDRGVSDRDRGVSDRYGGSTDRDRGVSDRDRGVSDRDRGVSDRYGGSTDRDRGISDRDRAGSDRYLDRGGGTPDRLGGNTRPAGRSTSMVEPKVTARSERGLRSGLDDLNEDAPPEDVPAADDSPTALPTFMVKGEVMPAKTSFQKSAKGPISISDCAQDGVFISIENTGRKEENVGGWTLKRTVDDIEVQDFIFPPETTIESASKMKVWARGSKPADAPTSDIEGSALSWGIGSNVTTKLVNPAGEDRATHVQKTSFA